MYRFFSKLWENFKEYIILVVLLITSLIILSLNTNPAVRNVKAIAFGSFAAATSFVSDIVNVAKVKSENDRLRKINAELMLKVNKLRHYGIIYGELKQLLELKDSLNYPLIPATIVSKSLTKSQGSITLSVGRSDSVKAGMPVINSQGLIGIVYSTSENYSIVRTLKNRDLHLTVKDERSRIDGIMKWNGENLIIINVPKTFDVEAGDRIITSELSSIVNMPLPIGVVQKLSNLETGIFNEVVIKPYVNFSAIEHVFVIGVVESREKNNLELNFYNRN